MLIYDNALVRASVRRVIDDVWSGESIASVNLFSYAGLSTDCPLVSINPDICYVNLSLFVSPDSDSIVANHSSTVFTIIALDGESVLIRNCVGVHSGALRYSLLPIKYDYPVVYQRLIVGQYRSIVADYIAISKLP